MKKQSEDSIQQQMVIWFTNNYCLKSHNPRGLIFAIPNGGMRNIREALKLKATGTLSGASDLIVILPNSKLLFVEVKTEIGIQSDVQKEFEKRVNELGYEYHLVRSLNDFKYIVQTFKK